MLINLPSSSLLLCVLTIHHRKKQKSQHLTVHHHQNCRHGPRRPLPPLPDIPSSSISSIFDDDILCLFRFRRQLADESPVLRCQIFYSFSVSFRPPTAPSNLHHHHRLHHPPSLTTTPRLVHRSHPLPSLNTIVIFIILLRCSSFQHNNNISAVESFQIFCFTMVGGYRGHDCDDFLQIWTGVERRWWW